MLQPADPLHLSHFSLFIFLWVAQKRYSTSEVSSKYSAKWKVTFLYVLSILLTPTTVWFTLIAVRTHCWFLFDLSIRPSASSLQSCFHPVGPQPVLLHESIPLKVPDFTFSSLNFMKILQVYFSSLSRFPWMTEMPISRSTAHSNLWTLKFCFSLFCNHLTDWNWEDCLLVPQIPFSYLLEDGCNICIFQLSRLLMP